MVARTKFQVVAEETKYKYPVISTAFATTTTPFCLHHFVTYLTPCFPPLPEPSFSTSLPVPFFHCKPLVFIVTLYYFWKTFPEGFFTSLLPQKQMEAWFSVGRFKCNLWSMQPGSLSPFRATSTMTWNSFIKNIQLSSTVLIRSFWHSLLLHLCSGLKPSQLL